MTCEQRVPKFGDWMRGIHAAESNPHRDGMFVEVIKRAGRVNRGTFYRLTDGRGKFWLYPVGAVVLVSDASMSRRP